MIEDVELLQKLRTQLVMSRRLAAFWCDFTEQSKAEKIEASFIEMLAIQARIEAVDRMIADEKAMLPKGFTVKNI